MSCVKCKKSFTSQSHSKSLKTFPVCGHKICKKCLFKLQTDSQAKCPKCKKINRLDSFRTQNSAKKSKEKSIEEKKRYRCEKHNKTAEAFCIEDFKFTCVDCLIFDDYKDKKVMKVEDAYKILKEEFDVGIKELKPLAQNVEKNLKFFNDQEAILDSFKDAANKKVDDFMDKILKVVTDRKNQLLEKILEIYVKTKNKVVKKIQIVKTAAELGIEFDKYRNSDKFSFLKDVQKRRKCFQEMKEKVKETKPKKKNEVINPFEDIFNSDFEYEYFGNIFLKEVKKDDLKKNSVSSVSKTLTTIKHKHKRRVRKRSKTPRRMKNASKSPNLHTKNLAQRRKEMKALKQKGSIETGDVTKKRKKKKKRGMKRSKSAMRGSPLPRVNTAGGEKRIDVKSKFKRMREERKKSPIGTRKHSAKEDQKVKENFLQGSNNTKQNLEKSKEELRREFEINLLTDQRISMLADSINSTGLSSFQHSNFKNNLRNLEMKKLNDASIDRVLQFNKKAYDNYNVINHNLVESKLIQKSINLPHENKTNEKKTLSPWAKRKQLKIFGNNFSPNPQPKLMKFDLSGKQHKTMHEFSINVSENKIENSLSTKNYIFESVEDKGNFTPNKKPPVPKKSFNSPYNAKSELKFHAHSPNYNNSSAENIMLTESPNQKINPGNHFYGKRNDDFVKIHNSGNSIHFNSNVKITPDQAKYKKSGFSKQDTKIENIEVPHLDYMKKVDISMSGGSLLFQNKLQERRNFLDFEPKIPEEEKPVLGDLYCIGGVSSTSGMMVERLKEGDGNWEILDNGEKSRCKFGCVFLSDTKLLIFGGKSGEGRLKDSVIYDVEKGEWIMCSFELNTGLSGFGHVMIKGKLYIAGGNNGESILNSLEEYNLMTGTSRKLASMNQPRDEFCMLYLNGYLYAIGGGGEKGKNLRTVERYDFKRNIWENDSSLLIPRRAHAGVTAGGNLYVTGGFDGEKYLCSVERYDAEKKCWDQMKFLNQSRCTHSAVVMKNEKKIVVTGGFNGKSLDTVEEYDIEKNIWVKKANLKLARFMHFSFCYYKGLVFFYDFEAKMLSDSKFLEEDYLNKEKM